MAQIDCPFCWAVINEEVMSKHIAWHFPGDEQDPEKPIFESDIPEGIQIEL